MEYNHTEESSSELKDRPFESTQLVENANKRMKKD